MTTSPATDPADRTRVPDKTLWFYQGRVEETIYDLIVGEFYRQEDAGLISKAVLAKRLGRRPEQISRWLAAPSNLTLDTISDLLVGLRVSPILTIEGLPFVPSAQEAAPDSPHLIDDIAAVLAGSEHMSSDTQRRLNRTARTQPVRPEINESILVGLVSGQRQPASGRRPYATQHVPA